MYRPKKRRERGSGEQTGEEATRRRERPTLRAPSVSNLCVPYFGCPAAVLRTPLQKTPAKKSIPSRRRRRRCVRPRRKSTGWRNRTGRRTHEQKRRGGRCSCLIGFVFFRGPADRGVLWINACRPGKNNHSDAAAQVRFVVPKLMREDYFEYVLRRSRYHLTSCVRCTITNDVPVYGVKETFCGSVYRVIRQNHPVYQIRQNIFDFLRLDIRRYQSFFNI